MPTKYGVTRNKLFERQLWDACGLKHFTTGQAEKIYKDCRPPSPWLDSMNARNYLAGAVTAKVLRRVRRGVYAFI